ncbi:MAG: hypothetical protein WDN75_10710 [Bacteroidota bacterium]
MAGTGTVVLTIAAGVVADPIGNLNTVGTFTDNSVTFDDAGPTVTVNQAGSQVDPTIGTTITFTAVFNKAINPATFTAADITITGTATGATAGTPTTLTIHLEYSGYRDDCRWYCNRLDSGSTS